ncbi:hypothetical protein F4604DRAFT_1954749, partial [Suillus subluteus]
MTVPRSIYATLHPSGLREEHSPPSSNNILSKNDPTLEHLPVRVLIHTNHLQSDATHRRCDRAKLPAFSLPHRSPRPPPTIGSRQPMILRRLFRFSSRTPYDQPRDPLDFPATSPLPPNRALLTQATDHSSNFEISSHSRHSNGVTQSPHQGLSFCMFGPRHEPRVVEVTAGRKSTRFAAVKLPEYRKVDDTRHRDSCRQQTASLQDDPS